MLVRDMPTFRARRHTPGSPAFNRLRYGLVVRAPEPDVIRTPDGREVRPLGVRLFQDQAASRIKACILNDRKFPDHAEPDGSFKLRVWRPAR